MPVCGELHSTAASFCENSERTVRACELSPCFCFASVLSQFGEKKVWRPQRSEFLQSQGVTLSLSVAVGVLTDRAVGMCLTEKTDK